MLDTPQKLENRRKLLENYDLPCLKEGHMASRQPGWITEKHPPLEDQVRYRGLASPF
jgi:hypothetical protein